MKPLPRIARDLAASLLLALAATGAAAGGNELPGPLAPFEARYLLTDGSARVGSADIGLESAREGWRYYSRVKPEGLYALLAGEVEDTAWLETHGGGLRPLRFRHVGNEPDERITVEFDWDAARARVSGPGREAVLPLEPGTHDQFSAMLAVIQAFAAERTRLELPSIDDEGEAEPLVFEHAGTASITVPLGTYETVHVRRVRKNSKRETDTWLAPALDWVPVRIDQRKKGELVARLELMGLNGEMAEMTEESPR